MWRLCDSSIVLLATEQIYVLPHLSEKGDVLILYSSSLINMHLFLYEGLLFRDDFHLSFLTALEVNW